jgi:hypothetical protein
VTTLTLVLDRQSLELLGDNHSIHWIASPNLGPFVVLHNHFLAI